MAPFTDNKKKRKKKKWHTFFLHYPYIHCALFLQCVCATVPKEQMAELDGTDKDDASAKNKGGSETEKTVSPQEAKPAAPQEPIVPQGSFQISFYYRLCQRLFIRFPCLSRLSDFCRMSISCANSWLKPLVQKMALKKCVPYMCIGEK